MNKLAVGISTVLMSTTAAMAGGLDRSGQGISPIFEDGRYMELSFGSVSPSVSGLFGGALSSGDMASSYATIGAAYKMDVGESFSLAFIYEEAFGANVDYTGTDPGYPVVTGFTAELNGKSLSVLGRYKIADRISVHGGLRYVSMTGTIDQTLNAGPVLNYAASDDIGYVVGAAYEIPEIALRGSITYSSATDHNNSITVGGFPTGASTGAYTMPESVNIDFQTGIAENTLLMASARWADWTSTAINTSIGGLGTIDYNNDVWTYSLGVARRFSDKFAGVARISYEESDGLPASNLAPTDGKIGLTLAGIYSMGNADITVGVNYTKLGNATTELIGASFSDNDAVGVGVKLGVNF